MNYFERNYGLRFEGRPTLDADIEKEVDLDKEVKASGFLKDELGKDFDKIDKVFNQITDTILEEGNINKN